jgi:vitamin B12 transporter
MRRALLFATAGLLAGPAFAEAPLAAPEEVVVVTALRLPAAAETVPGVRVIERDDLDRTAARFAADALELVPGLSVSRQGAFGGTTSLRIRGAGSDKTLVLIDGVPVNDPSQPSGAYDFGALDLADVERIEILSGPQGSLWGSDAIGGVVSFRSREPDGARAELETGSFGTVRGSAAVGRTGERGAFGLSASALTTDGVSAAADGTEDDGYENRTASAWGRLAVGDRLTLDARLRYVESDAEADGYDPVTFAFGDTAERSTSETWSGHVRARLDDVAGFEHELLIGAYDLERAFTGGAFPSRYTADRQVYRYVGRREREAWGAAFGVEREEERADLSTGDGAFGETAVFAIGRAEIGRATVTGSLRWDDPDAFDAEATARLAAAVPLAGGFVLRASAGQGFKTPTVSQALCDFCFPAGPSVGLKPERADGIDFGLDWASIDGRLTASALVYRLEVEDQIDYVFDPATFESRYRNIDRTRTDGAELEAAIDLGDRWSLQAAYAWTDAQDRSTGARLPRVPEHSGSVAAFWTGARARAGLIVRGEGRQADVDPSAFAAAERPGFVTADLNGGFRLTERVELTLRIENLLDQDYEETLGYGEPGRSAYAGVRLRY